LPACFSGLAVKRRRLLPSVLNKPTPKSTPWQGVRLRTWDPLNLAVVAGALGGAAPALVVDLGRGDEAVAQKVLHFPDIHAGVERHGGGRRPKRVRGVKRKGWPRGRLGANTVVDL